MRYLALLDRKGGIVVPDLPGCTSGRKTVDAAYRNAIAAVRLWVEDALADGEKPPRPRSLMEMLANREVRRALAAGAALMIVPVVRDSGRQAKANISVDAGTLAAIDEEAAAQGSRARPSSPARRWKRSAAGPSPMSKISITTALLLLALAAPANAQQSIFHDAQGRVTGSARTDAKCDDVLRRDGARDRHGTDRRQRGHDLP